MLLFKVKKVELRANSNEVANIFSDYKEFTSNE